MNKLSNIISSMNYQDIKAIEKDLYEGNIAKLVQTRKKWFENLVGEKNCPTCGNPVNENDSGYTLQFGPSDFRKKATFCGLDCLSYFIKKLEQEVSKNHE
jgi:hypothetical protein